MARCFLILHGLNGSDPPHWQAWLAERLREDGEDVRFPALPAPDEPRAAEWAAALHDELAAMPGERVVVCHSLACLLWAREAGRVAADGPADRVLLVSPPCPVAPIAGVQDFHPTPLDADAVAASAASLRVVCSDSDPYCPAGARRSFADPLGLPVDLVPGAGHLNVEAGYGPWPAVHAWCRDGGGPLA